MKTRLKILCWLFAASYLYVIAHTIINDFIPGFTSGSKAGTEEAEYYHENKNKGDEKHKLEFMRRLHVRVVPVNGEESYPDRLINDKTGEEVLAESSELYLGVRDLPQMPWYLVVGKVLVSLLALVTLFIFIYVPILSFKTIRSIVKNDIFDEKNIRRIRWIGYSLIVAFLFGLFYSITSKAIAEYLVTLKNYKIVSLLDGEDIFILTLGIMVLIFAEILKIATQIKEEQDLTV